jgi:hypothetical protein
MTDVPEIIDLPLPERRDCHSRCATPRLEAVQRHRPAKSRREVNAPCLIVLIDERRTGVGALRTGESDGFASVEWECMMSTVCVLRLADVYGREQLRKGSPKKRIPAGD